MTQACLSGVRFLQRRRQRSVIPGIDAAQPPRRARHLPYVTVVYIY